MKALLVVHKSWPGTHLFPSLYSDVFVGFSDDLIANTATRIQYSMLSLDDAEHCMVV